MKRLYALLSSKAFLIWLLSGWVVYYVTNAVWSKEAFSNFIGSLSKNPLTQIPYVVFLLSLLLNIIRASGERLRERPKKGVIRLVLWIVLPAGALMFFSGYFISSAFRHQELILVGEGENIGPAWRPGAYLVKKISPSLKDETLEMAGEEGAIFAYEPKVALSSGDRDYEVGAFPPKRIDGTYYHILNFGLAPRIRFSDNTGVVTEGDLALRILPPGVEDSFKLDPLPYRVVLRISPDRVIEKGETRAKVYSLKSPSYSATVFKGEETVFEGDSRQGVAFDGYRLEFLQPTYWVHMEVVKDPGVFLIIAGLFFIALGILLRPIGFIIMLIKA